MKTIAIAILYILVTSSLFADWNEMQKLLASEGSTLAHFGYSISISGDYALIGAPNDNDDYGHSTGSAYIIVRDGDDWSEQEKLLAPDGATEDRFGYSVSVTQDYAVIGAMHDDDDGYRSGSAYIFVRDGETWSEQAKLNASDGDIEDYFGAEVSIEGDYALIGAPSDDDDGLSSGSAYIFYRNGNIWTEHAKLTSSEGDASDYFGCSVSIEGDYAVIGAEGNNNFSGAAYIFARSGDTWSEQVKLTASDGAHGDSFGRSVSIEGDYAVIGAFHDDNDNGEDSGSVYIFARSGDMWAEQAKLTPSNGAAYDFFGWSVSISEDYTIIGAVNSAYIFTRSGDIWAEQVELTASDGALGVCFGLSVSLIEDYALIGAFRDSDNGAYSGSAYIFNNDGLSAEDIPVEQIFSNLHTNYPNPFNPQTSIKFNVLENEEGIFTIYNVKGQEIVSEQFPSGSHNYMWNAEEQASGIYFYQLKTESTSQVKKMVLLK